MKKKKHHSSIIQDEKKCFITGATVGLHEHHCIHGYGNRDISEALGLKVWLREDIHMKLHDTGEHDLELKQVAQRAYENTYGDRESFMRLFGRNYLDEN